jgi:hypothetical protein
LGVSDKYNLIWGTHFHRYNDGQFVLAFHVHTGFLDDLESILLKYFFEAVNLLQDVLTAAGILRL